MSITNSTTTKERKSGAQSEGLATWQSGKGPGFLTACLYRVQGQQTEALGAAEINVSDVPWELTLAAAPGHGLRFFQMLIALSGDNGLTPTRTGGEVTPKAAAVFHKLYSPDDFRKDHLDGPHFEPWLNSIYYTHGNNPGIRQRLKNHKYWSRGRTSLFSWMRVGAFPNVHWLSDQSRQLLNGASFLYCHGEEGFRAIATYAAKLLWQEYRKEGSPEVSALYPTERYPGFVTTETPHRQTVLFRSETDARAFAVHMDKELTYKTLDHVVPVIHVDLHKLVQNNPLLYERIARRLGMVTWSFLAAYWDIVADELCVNHATAFVDESCIYLQEKRESGENESKPENG